MISKIVFTEIVVSPVDHFKVMRAINGAESSILQGPV